MRRVVSALVVATIVAVAAIRRYVPTAKSRYSGPDAEGDAILPADPYLVSIGAMCRTSCGCGGHRIALSCKSVVGCVVCIDGYDLR